MDIDYPFSIDAGGRTKRTTPEDHVRDLVEQVLFTSPGERVNRPEFGSGLMQLVFAASGEELATTTQFLVQGALQRFLGEVIQIQDVSVVATDAVLEVTVSYALRSTGRSETQQFVRSLG